MRGLPILIVLIAVFIAYGVYLHPTEAQLAFVRIRLSVALGELATLRGRPLIAPRLRREQREIAKRLERLIPASPSQAEVQFVAEAASLARRTRTHITQIVSKGAMLPLLEQTAKPSANAPSHVTPLASGPAALSIGEVRGLRLPRTLTVEGSFGNLLRFVDGLGALHPLVRVNSAGLVQTDRLRATIDLDLVVIDAEQMREALL